MDSLKLLKELQLGIEIAQNQNDHMDPKPCQFCNRMFDHPDDLRPYGPDGKDICYDCGMKPEYYDEVDRRMNALFETIVSQGNVVVLGGGPPTGVKGYGS